MPAKTALTALLSAAAVTLPFLPAGAALASDHERAEIRSSSITVQTDDPRTWFDESRLISVDFRARCFSGDRMYAIAIVSQRETVASNSFEVLCTGSNQDADRLTFNAEQFGRNRTWRPGSAVVSVYLMNSSAADGKTLPMRVR
jgi:hypothetical protein